MSNLNAVTLQSVAIERGKDTIVREFPEHEVLVLRRIHRPDHIRVLDKAVGVIELDRNAHAEMLRLQNKYRRTGSQDPAMLAFPGGTSDLERYGFSLDGESVEAPQALVKNHAKEAKPAKADKKAA